MLAIIEYGAGNQTSVLQALKHLKIDATITNDINILNQANGIIFPGVGQASQAMQALKKLNLDDTLYKLINKNIPLLGICIGCQILLEYSEENDTKALGIFKGKCLRFPDSIQPIPHMGWNNINIKKNCILLNDIDKNAEFYFVHSYYPEVDNQYIISTTTYGITFCSIYGRDGLWATQFHPEKSGRPGLKLLQNFAKYCKELNHA